MIPLTYYTVVFRTYNGTFNNLLGGSYKLKSSVYPPGPKGIPLIGSFFEFYSHPIGFLEGVSRDYGDVAYFRLGWFNFFLLSNPEYIQDVLVNHYGNFAKGRAWERGKGVLGEGLLTSEGDYHRRQRRLARPAFHSTRIESYGALMTEYAFKVQQTWKDGAVLSISREMYRLTLSIVAKSLFGAEVESETKEISEALTIFRNQWWRTVILPSVPFSSLFQKLPLPSIRQFNQAKRRLDATIYRIIDERRISGEDKGDLLSMLLSAQDDDGSGGGGMTDLQVRDEAMTIFLAGHETTASSLAWTWYLISQHPEVEERLRAEIDTVLNGRLPTVQDLTSLRYTRMVFAETIRLYPPVWLITRRALKPYRVGSFVIPADSVIQMCPFLVHRDPRYYSEPLNFKPERWDTDSGDKRPKFAYFPFGGGPRYCLGDQFASMEAALIIATIIQRWKFQFIDDKPVEPEPYITLRPKHGVRMRLTKLDRVSD